jgi:SH3-like domain-containing protein
MEAVVGSTPFDLVITGSGSNNILGMGETNLGDFVADAYRNYFHADVAFVHASTFGFLGLSQGEITNADLYGPLPDENDVCLIEASGQQLLDALEMGARYYPSACMGWIHPSGLTYEVDADQESGVDTDEQNGFAGVHGVYRVRKVLVNGEKLDLSKTYTLALGADYYLYGKEGMTMFADCPVLAPEDWTRAVSDRTVTAAYLSMIGTVGDEYRNPDGDGRIRIISGGSVVSSGSSQSGNGGTSDLGSTAQLAGDTYVVRKTGLKLCSDQSLGSPVCDLVPGELLCVRDTGSGTAYEVVYGTLTGWVDASGLALLQSGYCGIVEGSSVYVNANAAENTAQLRVKPNASARVGANLPYGQDLLVRKLKKEWAKVKCADGTEGWIRLCELGIYVPAYRYVVWYESGIQVRESPSADAKRLGSLSGGDVVDILEVENGWGKTTSNGWVCMRNLAAIAK